MTRRITDIVAEGEVLGVSGGVAASLPFPAEDQTAAEVAFTPAGGIAATNVQAALVELDTEKLASVDITDLTATGTPSATTYLRGDNTWATPSGGGASGTGLLAVASYNPATRVNAAATGAATALDTTNLRASFTVPASGAVILTMTGWVYATAGNVLNWAVLSGASTVAGSDAGIHYHTATGEVQHRVVHRAYISGLTAASTATWDFAHYRTFGSGSIGTQYGGTASTGNPGPISMEIWSA